MRPSAGSSGGCRHPESSHDDRHVVLAARVVGRRDQCPRGVGHRQTAGEPPDHLVIHHPVQSVRAQDESLAGTERSGPEDIDQHLRFRPDAAGQDVPVDGLARLGSRELPGRDTRRDDRVILRDRLGRGVGDDVRTRVAHVGNVGSGVSFCDQRDYERRRDRAAHTSLLGAQCVHLMVR